MFIVSYVGLAVFVALIIMVAVLRAHNKELVANVDYYRIKWKEASSENYTLLREKFEATEQVNCERKRAIKFHRLAQKNEGKFLKAKKDSEGFQALATNTLTELVERQKTAQRLNRRAQDAESLSLSLERQLVASEKLVKQIKGHIERRKQDEKADLKQYQRTIRQVVVGKEEIALSAAAELEKIVAKLKEVRPLGEVYEGSWVKDKQS